MNQFEMLQAAIAAQAQQIHLLRAEMRQFRRAGGADQMLIEEWCRVNSASVNEAFTTRRTEIIRALRGSLSARRVGKLFGISGRRVQQICCNRNFAGIS